VQCYGNNTLLVSDILNEKPAELLYNQIELSVFLRHDRFHGIVPPSPNKEALIAVAADIQYLAYGDALDI